MHLVTRHGGNVESRAQSGPPRNWVSLGDSPSSDDEFSVYVGLGVCYTR